MKKYLITFGITLLLIGATQVSSAPSGGSYYFSGLFEFATTTTGCLNGGTDGDGDIIGFLTGTDCGTGSGFSTTSADYWKSTEPFAVGYLTATSTATSTFVGGIFSPQGFDGGFLTAKQVSLGTGSATSSIYGNSTGIGIDVEAPSQLLDLSGGGNILLSSGSATANWIGSSANNLFLPLDNGGRTLAQSAGSFYINIDSNSDQSDRQFIVANNGASATAGTNLFIVNESGSVQFPVGYGAGILHSSSSGVLTSSDVVMATDTSGDFVGTITGGVGIDSTGATSGEDTDHTFSLNLNELTTEGSIATADFIAMVDDTDDGSGKVLFSNFVGGNWTGTLDSLEGASFLRSDASDTATGLITLEGGLTMQVGDTFTFSGDAFTDFVVDPTISFSSGGLRVVDLNCTNCIGATEIADVDVASGGSGASTLTGLLQGNGTSAFTAVSNSSTVGQILRVTGTSAYGWGALNLDDTDAFTGTLPVANTQLTAGTNITLSTDQLNVDDSFLTNTGNDTTDGQLTALNFVANSSSATSTFAHDINIASNRLMFDRTNGHLTVSSLNETASPAFSVFSDGGLGTNGGTPIFRVQSNNRVGIGTTTAGSVFSITNFSTTNPIANFTEATSTLYGALTTDSLEVRNASSTGILFIAKDSNGQVTQDRQTTLGLGNNFSYDKTTGTLNIGHQSDNGSNIIATLSDGGGIVPFTVTDAPWVGIGTGSRTTAGTIFQVEGDIVFNDDSGDFDFRVEGNGQASLFVIDASADRIGIATNLPGDALHIKAAKNSATTPGVGGLMISDTTSGIGNGGLIIFRGKTSFGDTNAAAIHACKNSATTNKFGFDLCFNTRVSGGGTTQKLVITHNGGLGLGVTYPTALFDIATTTGFGSVKMDGPSGGCIILRDTDDAGWTKLTVLNGVGTFADAGTGVC